MSTEVSPSKGKTDAMKEVTRHTTNTSTFPPNDISVVDENLLILNGPFIAAHDDFPFRLGLSSENDSDCCPQLNRSIRKNEPPMESINH